MPENTFWHEMSPARLHALFDAYFGDRKREDPEKGPSGARRGLFDYIRGGE